eukprot:1804455-Lingulodinium_polyedra.AAC.1
MRLPTRSLSSQDDVGVPGAAAPAAAAGAAVANTDPARAGCPRRRRVSTHCGAAGCPLRRR